MISAIVKPTLFERLCLLFQAKKRSYEYKGHGTFYRVVYKRFKGKLFVLKESEKAF